MISERFPSLSYMFNETFMSAGSDDVKKLSNSSSKVGAGLVRKPWTGKKNGERYITRNFVVYTHIINHIMAFCVVLLVEQCFGGIYCFLFWGINEHSTYLCKVPISPNRVLRPLSLPSTVVTN
jgi:hypothetical protein